MKRFKFPGRKAVTAVVVVVLFARSTAPANAESPVQLKKFEGAIDLQAPGPLPFVLTGNASRRGKFPSYGEVDFGPGPEPGSLVGEGGAVFEAANGDLLVGAVSWEVAAGSGDFRTSRIHFSWRDAVTFSDGTVVA